LNWNGRPRAHSRSTRPGDFNAAAVAVLSQYYLPGRAWARRKTNPMEKVPLIGNRDEITGGKSLTLLRHKN